MSHAPLYPQVCKSIGCSPDGGFTYLNCDVVIDQPKPMVKINYIKGCSCKVGGVSGSIVYESDSLLYKLATKIIIESNSPIEIVKNFAVMALNLNSKCLKSFIEFHRYDTDSTTTFKKVNSWLDLIDIERVNLSSIDELEIVVRENGIALVNGYLTAGYFSGIQNSQNIKVCGILNVVKMRDRNAVLDLSSTRKFDVKNASMGVLTEALNSAYFTHYNPLHEIQWIVAGIAKKHNQFDDQETNSLIRIAIHYLWKYREGEVDREFGIIDSYKSPLVHESEGYGMKSLSIS